MRRIAIITGTRAEYGLLYWLIKEFNSDPGVDFQLMVTGMHLSPEFGLTINEIEKDGFQITHKVDMMLSSDTVVAIAKSIGLGIISFADIFATAKPDLIVVLGDRYEIFAAVSAALIARIPVAHCHGGETSEGVIDEGIRHSITKMSHLHFTATREYTRRVIQLGENPGRVFTVGALGIESIRKLSLLSRKQFEESINFTLGGQSAVITFHPVTLENATAHDQFRELLSVLDRWPDMKLIFTKPNSDTDGRIIIQLIDEFVSKNTERACAFHSLGQLRYLSCLLHVDAVIGNSSSGIIEAPSFGKPTVNIGDRQSGRTAAESVINCLPVAADIQAALEKAISPEFRTFCENITNPYDMGISSEKILPVLKNISLDGILKKEFYNLP